MILADGKPALLWVRRKRQRLCNRIFKRSACVKMHNLAIACPVEHKSIMKL